MASMASLSVAVAGRAVAQSVTPAPLQRAVITFAMKATKVNDFVGRVDTVRAQFSGTALHNVTGWVEFRVRDMRTGIGLRDSHMRNIMRVDSFPTIRFELVGLDLGAEAGDSVSTVFQGSLTIHGVTHTIRVPGAVVVRGGTATATTSFPLDMREYGIPPPSRFFGAVKVDPVAGIRVVLVFGG
jgi:polyisoprenoid-binding protein YceI